jgi:D-alanyl-D-alanine carboxypeptidase/D-alanyl-D-alanine-endopeptidase (penicillin-binding protein 4)
MVRTRSSIVLCLLAGLLLSPQSIATAADSIAISSAFSQLVSVPSLADPSVIVLDERTGEVVFESNSKSARKPASVIKLLSATAAYTYLNPSDSYTTTLSEGVDGKSVVINGSLDPWISYDNKVAEKMGRTSLERFEFNALSAIKRLNSGSTKNTTIYYNDLYAADVNHISRFLKAHHLSIALKKVSEQAAVDASGARLISSSSPTLEKILDWTLTWSDNLLAERIARLASVAAGNTLDDAGVEVTFKTLLSNYGITTSNLVIKDASGLSKENRITADQIAKLLMIIYHDQKFSKLIAGLPIGGVSGTLQHRFIETAPEAVGLVRAKTGTLNGTTNLAGYVESGDHEYIFVILADRHSKSYSVTKKVRATVDRILGKIAAPLLPELLPIAPVGETLTITN